MLDVFPLTQNEVSPVIFYATIKLVMITGGVKDTRLYDKTKDTKKRGQGQTLSRRRTGMLEAKDTGPSVLKKKSSKKFFRQKWSQTIFSGKNGLKEFFSGNLRSRKKRSSQIFREVSGVFQQNFNSSKNSAVLEPRTGQFSRICGFEVKAKGLTFEAKTKDFKMCH